MTRILIITALVLGVVLVAAAFGSSDPFAGEFDANRLTYLLLALLLVGGSAWRAVTSQGLGRTLTFVAIWIAIGVVAAGAYLLFYGSDAPVGTR